MIDYLLNFINSLNHPEKGILIIIESEPYAEWSAFWADYIVIPFFEPLTPVKSLS